MSYKAVPHKFWFMNLRSESTTAHHIPRVLHHLVDLELFPTKALWCKQRGWVNGYCVQPWSMINAIVESFYDLECYQPELMINPGWITRFWSIFERDQWTSLSHHSSHLQRQESTKVHHCWTNTQSTKVHHLSTVAIPRIFDGQITSYLWLLMRTSCDMVYH